MEASKTRRPVTPGTPITASSLAIAAMPAAEKSDARTEWKPAFAVILNYKKFVKNESPVFLSDRFPSF
jgi:hypothetical protein